MGRQSRKVLHNGTLKTIKEAAEAEGISYHAMYQRYKAVEEGKPKRKTNKRKVQWRDKSGKLHKFDSISKLAEFLEVSREWARQLVNKQQRGGNGD